MDKVYSNIKLLQGLTTTTTVLAFNSRISRDLYSLDLYNAAQANLKRDIRKAKTCYRRRIEYDLAGNNSWQVWRAIQYVTNLGAAEGNLILAEELNIFFALLKSLHLRQHSYTTWSTATQYSLPRNIK